MGKAEERKGKGRKEGRWGLENKVVAGRQFLEDLQEDKNRDRKRRRERRKRVRERDSERDR